MLIKSIVLVAEDYGPNKGRLQGHISFVGQYGEVKLTLQQEHVSRITELLAGSIIEAAQETAQLMTKAVIEQGSGRIAITSEAEQA